MERRVAPPWRAAFDAAANEKHGLYSRFHHGHRGCA
jgi:hypothetical protein